MRAAEVFFEAVFGVNMIPPCADLKARYAKHCSPNGCGKDDDPRRGAEQSPRERRR